MSMFELQGSTLDELKQWLAEHGQQSFRADQIIQWIYERGVVDFESMTNLAAPLRAKLAESLLSTTLTFVRSVDSADGETTKFLWKLADGKLVESVLIYSAERRTVCVSSQVGCPARCAFCASGKQGLMRNLSAAEIVDQVYQIDLLLKKKGERVSNVVFMGMGEPLENYEAVVKAIRLLSDEKRLGISQRRMTVSTVGIVEKIRQLADEGLKVSLVLSLHAPNQRVRQKIIPFARKYALPDILEAMRHFARTTKRDITYEYTLLAGINDQLEHAQELAELLRDEQCTVNLIPYNPVEGLNLQRPEKEQIIAFKELLETAGLCVTWRYTKGKDIAAACGQLALQKEA
jgi:23S rRNA (adenine2503-C2)-methyltransferase